MEDPIRITDTLTDLPVDDRSCLQVAVLRVLAYFDVFNHPLRSDEVVRFIHDAPHCEERINDALNELRQRGAVQQSGAYWGLEDVQQRVVERELAEQRATARMPKADRMARLVARFPFVRAVFISGSMSKGCLAVDGDIDFFIVTEPGRLWVARTLLVLYKKLFLLNSRRDLCVNYFLDTEHLTVEDRNHFTAIEVVTLLPMYGNGTTEAFFERNAWAFQLFPGTHIPRSREVLRYPSRIKRFAERILAGRLGTWLDTWSMQITWHYWKRKFDHLDPKTFDLALRTRTYVSKHHPRNFQARVLEGYDRRLAQLSERLGMPLI